MSHRARVVAGALALLVPIAAVHAAALTITKSSVVVADAVNALNPKALPGATIDYSLLVSDTRLTGLALQSVTIEDAIPANTVFRTDDYGTAGKGPIEFADGNLLGTGLLASGVSLSFKGLASDTDGVEFSNGATWSYHPTGGYDPNVKAIRVKLTGSQSAGSTFRLRFRVRLS